MTFVVQPIGELGAGYLLETASEDGWVYDDWRLSAASREKILALWPELALNWVDLAARQFEAACEAQGSNKDGFVGWREDIEAVSSATAKLLKALNGCAFPARYSLGAIEDVSGTVPLHEKTIEVLEVLSAEADRLKKQSADVDARRFPHALPDLIIKLAHELRCAGVPWDKKFGPTVTRLTILTLDGLNIRHSLDVRSSVKTALKSGDQRLEKLR